ncbi:hypothetical protein [Paucibacter sp. DJ2R-2]|uniref:hypothetical protein n=1 Tax=Paucibacter sp. DJ2R-2 TaxID=2893558 RepID=UPI0021E4F586|nr:hypothetical protein [Paucibacter sp. DJ2R-2]MCV2441284.1 hypothetical protein [Paucibacter sp. DJ2R-2]
MFDFVHLVAEVFLSTLLDAEERHDHLRAQTGAVNAIGFFCAWCDLNSYRIRRTSGSTAATAKVAEVKKSGPQERAL